MVPLEEYRALKALEQREAELYWVTHESRYPSSPGDNIPDGNVYDSMEALLASPPGRPRVAFTGFPQGRHESSHDKSCFKLGWADFNRAICCCAFLIVLSAKSFS